MDDMNKFNLNENFVGICSSPGLDTNKNKFVSSGLFEDDLKIDISAAVSKKKNSLEYTDGLNNQLMGPLILGGNNKIKRPLTGRNSEKTNHTLIRDRVINKDTQFTKKKDKTIRVKSHLSEKLALDQGEMFFSHVLDKHAL
jgi:predicted nucleotidyltransferase